MTMILEEYLFDAGPFPSWVLDRTTLRFLRVNASAIKLYGYTRAEFATLVLGDVAPLELDGRHRTHDGHELNVVVRTNTVRYGERDASLTVIVEATTTRRAHDEMLEATGRIAGGVAHHFNNILTAVRGYAELAGTGLSPTDAAQLDLREICAAVDRAATLTGELVAVGRRQILRPELLHVATLFGEVESDLRLLTGDRIQLAIRADPGLCPITADRHQLARAILNVVTNACEAMLDGGSLVVRAEDYVVTAISMTDTVGAPVGRYATITVEDDGRGMSPEVRTRALQPFFTTKPVGQGTGLGLSIVHGIVSQSGGYLAIDSLNGKGTRVQLWFPVALDRRENDSFGASTTRTQRATSNMERQ